jgi:hypothetical protein
VSTSQQRRSAAQTPAPVPNSQKQKTPVTLPPGLNAQEKKDAGLIGRVLDTTPKFAEFVANQAASGQLSSKQLNDLAYIAKQGQVHGRTDRQVITSLGKAMNGMQPSVQKAFLQEFGRAMVQDTWGNLKKFNDGIDAAGREAVTGLVTAALHPRDTFRNAQTAAVNGVAKGREELQLVSQATGLRPGNAQAARNQLGQQANAAGRYVRGIASDPGKIGAATFNALSLAFPTSGGRAALAAAGREAAAVGERAVGAVGRSSVGQTATQAVNSVKARGNQVLDTVAQGMFGDQGSLINPNRPQVALQTPVGTTRGVVDRASRSTQGAGATARSTPTPQDALKAKAKEIRALDASVLKNMENMGLGSHTIERHVSKQASYLVQRVQREGVDAASSYTDLSTATKAVLENLRNNADEIALYLQNADRSTRPKAFTFDHQREVGYGTTGKNITKGLTSSEVIIKYEPKSPYGFIVLTSTAKIR